MRGIVAVGVAAAITTSVVVNAQVTNFLEYPTWMVGTWAHQDGDKWADEYWSPPRGDIMLGAARTGRGNDLTSFEHTRIIRDKDGNLVFVAQPGGVAPTEFKIWDSGYQDIIFANPAHDYPQKVRYWRDGQLLRAEISKMDGSSTMSWSYSPMGSH